MSSPVEPAVREALVFDPAFHDVDALLERVAPNVVPASALEEIATVIQRRVEASEALTRYVMDLWQATETPQRFDIRIDGVEMERLDVSRRQSARHADDRRCGRRACARGSKDARASFRTTSPPSSPRPWCIACSSRRCTRCGARRSPTSSSRRSCSACPRRADQRERPAFEGHELAPWTPHRNSTTGCRGAGGQRPWNAPGHRARHRLLEFFAHQRLFDHPDPRRLDLRASLADLHGEWLVRVNRQRAAVTARLPADVSAS